MTLNCREGSGIFGKRRSQLCGPGFARSSASIAEAIAKACGRFGFGAARIDVRPVMAGGLGVAARAVLHSPALGVRRRVLAAPELRAGDGRWAHAATLQRPITIAKNWK